MRRPREIGGQLSLCIASLRYSGLVTRCAGRLASLNGTMSLPSSRSFSRQVSGFDRKRTSSMTPLSRERPEGGAEGGAAASAGSEVVLIGRERTGQGRVAVEIGW